MAALEGVTVNGRVHVDRSLGLDRRLQLADVLLLNLLLTTLSLRSSTEDAHGSEASGRAGNSEGHLIALSLLVRGLRLRALESLALSNCVFDGDEAALLVAEPLSHVTGVVAEDLLLHLLGALRAQLRGLI